MATLDPAVISTIISGIMLGIYKFFISRPSAKKQEQKILTKVDEKIKTETCPPSESTPANTIDTAEAQLKSAEKALAELRVERERYRAVAVSNPMPLDEAFYIIQKNVSMYDSITRYCSVSKMEYQKLVPKPAGEYTYFHNGYAIDYEIKHFTEVDDENPSVVHVSPTFRVLRTRVV